MPDLNQKLGFDASGAVKSLGDLAAALGNANQALINFNNSANKSGSKLPGNAKKTAAATKDLTVSFKTLFRVFQAQVFIRGFNAITSSIKEAITEAVKFRLRIAEIQSIGHDLGQTNDQLSDSVLRLSASLGKSAEDVAEGLYQVLSNQVVEASEAIGFLEKAQKLAIVTHGETKDAVNALSSVINSYGLSAGDAEHVTGTLFKTVELGRLRLADIANILGRVTPLTAEMGVKWEEAAAAIATMTRSGVKADTAVTQLRAVMQKIIKPTEDMKLQFREWGVKDGPDAIKTFGGLTGLLKKMAQETGGSSSEMAQYFRRVRAVVGVLGILNNDGETMVETLDEITKATNASVKAWDEYSATDAHKLTVAWQTLKVAAIDVGEALLPALTTAAEATGHWLGLIGDGIKEIRHEWSDASRIADENADRTKKAMEEIETAATEAANAQREANQDLEQFTRQMLSGLQQDWNQYADSAERAGDRVTNTFKSFTDDIAKQYADSFKGLEKFINDAKGISQEVTDTISEIDQKADERNHARRLRNANSEWERKKILASRFYKFENEVALQVMKGIQDERTKDATIDKIESARKIASEQELAAEKAGHFQDAENARSSLRNLDRLEKATAKAYLESRTSALGKAKEELAVHKQRLSEVKSITDQIVEQQKLLAKERDPDLQARTKAQIKKLTDELAKLQFTDLQKKFLDSLGIPNTIDEVNQQMTEGLEVRIKKVSVDFAAIQEQFDKDVVRIKAVVEIEDFEKLGAELGVDFQADDSAIERRNKVYEAAVETLKNNQQEVTALQAAEKLVDVEVKNVNAALKQGVIDKRAMNAEIAEEIGLVSGLATAWQSLFFSREAIESKIAEKTKEATDTVQERWRGYTDTLDLIRRIRDSIVDGNEVSQDAVNSVKLRIERLREEGKITSENAALLRTGVAGLDALLKQQNIVRERRNELEELNNGAAERAVELYNRAADGIIRTKDELKNTNTALNTAQTTTTQVATNAANAATNMGRVSTSASDTANSSQLAATNVNTLATNTGSAISQANALAIAAAKVADEFERAARAQAAAGAATAYFGGPTSYFADGGLARGQDTQPAMLAKGERVTDAKNSARFASELNAMNLGSQPVYREQGGSVTNVGDVNVTVNGGDSSQQTVREIGQQLRRELQRGTIKLR
jgi:TP901 family phage tail tape measure protein